MSYNKIIWVAIFCSTDPGGRLAQSSKAAGRDKASILLRLALLAEPDGMSGAQICVYNYDVGERENITIVETRPKL